MRAASSYCRAGHCEGGRGSASGAATRERTPSPAWRLRSASREGAPSAPANFYMDQNPHDATLKKSWCRRMAKGGGARAHEPAQRGWSPARPARRPAPELRPRARPPAEPSPKRMNQPRPAARPPRFLFSFSTPPAAGAARPTAAAFREHRAPHGLGAARPLLDSTPRSPGATARPAPGRHAASPPHHPRAVPRCSLRGTVASVCFRGAAGTRCDRSGGKPGVESPPPARPPPRSRPRARAAAHLARADPHVQPSPACPGGPELRVSTTPRAFPGEPDGSHKLGYLETPESVSVGLDFRVSEGLGFAYLKRTGWLWE